jgi:hypothetical protein
MNGQIQEGIGHLLQPGRVRRDQKAIRLMIKDSAPGATGSAFDFKWHIIKSQDVLDICGVRVIPLPVEHGRIINVGYLFDTAIAYFR